MAARPHSSLPIWPLAMLVLVLGLQASLVLNRAINWDEFFHYSQIHNLAAGRLNEPLQTFYTRLFPWITTMSGSGIDHIIKLRWIMFAAEFATIAAIAAVAARFASRSAAWLCALAYAGAGYVFQHATSFRYDTPTAALMMWAAYIMLRTRLNWIAVLGCGLLIGTAGLLTVKAALYAPVLGGIAWLRWHESGRKVSTLFSLAAIGGIAFATFAGLYGLHAAALPKPETVSSGALLVQSGETFLSFGLSPYWPHHLKGAAIAPVVTLAILALPFVLWREARPKAEKLALVGLTLPLATLAFYHNTAPYFFVFMLAPVCAALGPVMDKAIERYSEAKIAIVLGLLALAVWAMEKPGILDRQRQLASAAESLFPDHPAYFDSCAMLGSFPKANAFMTPVGLALYRQGAYPSMAETMAKRAVPLVVANDPVLERALTTREAVPELLPQDLAALRDSYVYLWGPFWVAGRVFGAPGEFVLRVPGAYRVEGRDLLLDGKRLRNGEIIELERGTHFAEPQATTVRLIWAKAGRAPANAAPAQPWFTDF
jgi:hypothetical protein